MKKLLPILILFLFAYSAGGQTVTTLAGTPGTAGFNPLPATIADAKFTTPFGIAVDAKGWIWVSETDNSCRIRMIAEAGNKVYTKSGPVFDPADLNKQNWGYINGTGSSAKYDSPTGIAFAPDGTMYIADYTNNVVRKANGITVENGGQTISTLAGDDPPGSAGDYVNGTGNQARFDGPIDLCVDASGNVYVVDQNNECIRKITPAGVVTHLAGSNTGASGHLDGTGTGALFNQPFAIAMYDATHVVVADCWNHAIRKVNITTGEVTTITGDPAVFDHVDRTLADARFRYPTGIAVDNQKNIYVSEGFDGQSNVIRKISSTTVTTIAGKYNDPDFHEDGEGTVSRFLNPFHLAFNADKSILYVSDRGNSCIRSIDMRPVPNFDATPISTNVGVVVSFTDKSIGDPTSWTWTITPNTYTWETGFNANSQNPQVKFTQAGTYTVSLEAGNISGSKIFTRTNYINVSSVTITNPPVANFSSDKTTCEPGEIIQFTDMSTQTPTEWEWTVNSLGSHQFVGGTTKASQHPQIQFDNAADFVVILKATNSKGSSSKPALIKVAWSVSVKEAEADNAVLIYPNPSAGEIKIEAENTFTAERVNVAVTDLSGKEVYSTTLNLNKNETVKLNALSSGMYLVNISDGTTEVSKKIVIQ